MQTRMEWKIKNDPYIAKALAEKAGLTIKIDERKHSETYEKDQIMNQTPAFGGKIIIGHLTYTEIRFWGLKTLATPELGETHANSQSAKSALFFLSHTIQQGES